MGGVAERWGNRPAAELQGDAHRRLIAATTEVATVIGSAGAQPWVLVGGLAVQLWVPIPRSTQDVDLGVPDPDEVATAVLHEVASATEQQNGVMIDGVPVDFLDGRDPRARGLSRKHPDYEVGLAANQALELVVKRTVIGPSEGSTSLPLAPPGILLAMKLLAIASVGGPGRQRSPEKQYSDVLDFVALARDLGADRLAADLHDSDDELLLIVRQITYRTLREQASVIARRTALDSGATPQVAPMVVRNLADDLLDEL